MCKLNLKFSTIIKPNQNQTSHVNPPSTKTFFSKKSSQMTKVSFSHFKLFLVFSLRFLIFFFSLYKFLFCCCFSPKIKAEKRRRGRIRTRRRQQKNLTMFHECARNHPQKQSFFLLSLVVHTNVHRSQQQHIDTTTFFLLSLFRRMLCFFLLLPSSVLRSRCVYFFVVFAPCYTTFSTTSASQETFYFWENRGREKRVSVRTVEKGISVLMVFCFHVDVSCTSIPRNLVLSLSSLRN